MKKILVAGLFISLFGAVNVVTARTDKEPVLSVRSEASTAYEMPPTPINGIDVPFDVLMDIQVEYQGYAVTQANRVMRNGAWLFLLRIDRGGIPHEYDSIYLLYDASWKLMGEEEKVAPPSPRVTPSPPPEEVLVEPEATPAPDVRVQDEPELPEEPVEEEVEDEPPLDGEIGGRGGGGIGPPPEDSDEPTEEPQELS